MLVCLLLKVVKQNISKRIPVQYVKEVSSRKGFYLVPIIIFDYCWFIFISIACV